MGSRSAAKASRSKAVSTAGTSKGPVKTGNTDGKQGQGEESEEYDDLSILRKSVGTSVNGLIHALKVFQTGTEEIRSLLSQECKVIYECRVCDNLFRSLANFLSHKRIYCKGVASALHPSGSSPCQPNGLLPYGGHSANTGESLPDGSLEMVIVKPEPPPKRQRTESPDHWLCNESTPSSDSTLVGPLPKLECSVPPIRRRKDICGVIEKLSKRASRQHLANTTAVASHFASFTGGKLCLDNAVTTSTSNALYMEDISETKNAVYQTLLCASSSSMKLSFSPSSSEHSTAPCIREAESSVDITNPVSGQDCMTSSIPKLSSASVHLSDPTSMSGITDCVPSFPAPHNLLIKNRVALMKEAIAESESGVLGPDGILIPTPKTNGPIFPPEVCSGGVSNSEGEEVEDEDEDGEEVSPKGKSKSDSSKGKSPEEKQEIICSICKAKFSTRKTLSHHMKSLHVMFRTYYRCPCCKNCFANNWSVYRHLYKVHRKTTDQVRKLRALIKKKAFRKKIIVPLPNSSSQQASQHTAPDQLKESSMSVPSSAPEKTSPPPPAKSTASSTSSSKIVSSAPGRSGSPLPPPSEATQFPAISAQHAQVLRKLENIVKQEDNNWRLESFPERPGMGQSCPGCNRRFERRAALASHAHSCHKRILLAAQKASRARNKQQQQKMTKSVATGAGLDGGKNGKDLPKSKEAAAGKHLAQKKTNIMRIKFGKGQAGIVNLNKGGKDKDSEDEGEAHSSGTSSNKPQSAKSASHKGGELPSQCAIGSSYNTLSDLSMPLERAKEEDWEEMERPNSASSFGTHRDSSSPLTIPTHPGRQQRIGIQIRKDYVKGDRASVCSSGPSPPPYPPSQALKEEEDVDEEVVVLSSTFLKSDVEVGVGSSKESSVATGGEVCSDPEGVNNMNVPLQSCSDGVKQAVEKEELDDEEADKTTSVEGSACQSDDDNSSTEDQTSSPEGKVSQTLEDPVQGSQVESIMGPHGEVKRVFLEVIVGGVADPNSLAADEEEGGKEDSRESVKKEEKRDIAGGGGASGPRRAPSSRGKPPPSLMISSQQRQGGRPVRNRVKVEREDFIYDLSDMKLSPTKKEDANSSNSVMAVKKPRRNLSQQQMVSSVSQGSNGSSVGGPSAMRQLLVPGVIKVDGSGRAQSSSSVNVDGGHSLRVYSGKAMGRSLPADKSVKVPVSTKGSYPPPHKLGDCRVVIGGLRSGDMTQLSVRRVYSSTRKVLSPSNMTPVAVESEESITYSTSKKCPLSKDCNIESSEVDEGLFADMGKIEAPTFEKPVGKTSSLLYQSDSLDSGDSVSDFGNVPHANSPIENDELNPTT